MEFGVSNDGNADWSCTRQITAKKVNMVQLKEIKQSLGKGNLIRSI